MGSLVSFTVSQLSYRFIEKIKFYFFRKEKSKNEKKNSENENEKRKKKVNEQMCRYGSS